MRNVTNPIRRSLQQGAQTLLVTLVLLLLSSLVMFYTARTAINEQRLSANEVRSKQARAAADAGAEYALVYFNSNRGMGSYDTGAAFSPVAVYSSGRPSYYQAAFCSPSAGDPECPASHATSLSCTAPTSSETRSPLIIACGWSDDDLAVSRIIMKAGATPSLAGQITAPVVTRGVSNLLVGGASILNYFNDLTVWAGGNVPTQSATGKTFIRNVATDPSASNTTGYQNTGNSPSCNNPPTGYTCSTSSSSIGPDVIINDTALSTLSASQFFSRFLGKSPDTYRDSTATYTVDLPGSTTSVATTSLSSADATSVAGLSGKQDAVIWIQGNASGISGTLGSDAHPVILVVDGNLDISANLTVYGLVYVTGQLTGNGSPTVYGALVAGSTNMNGNAKVIYDPTALANAGNLGAGAAVPGGWRDW